MGNSGSGSNPPITSLLERELLNRNFLFAVLYYPHYFVFLYENGIGDRAASIGIDRTIDCSEA